MDQTCKNYQVEPVIPGDKASDAEEDVDAGSDDAQDAQDPGGDQEKAKKKRLRGGRFPLNFCTDLQPVSMETQQQHLLSLTMVETNTDTVGNLRGGKWLGGANWSPSQTAAADQCCDSSGSLSLSLSLSPFLPKTGR